MKRVSEHGEQVALFEWASLQYGKYPGLELMFAIPNGAKMPYKKVRKGVHYCPERLKLIREGLKSGVPDIFLPVARGDYNGLFIEMKASGGKLTENQERYKRNLEAQNYRVTVCWGFEEARDEIVAYYSKPRRTFL